MMLPLLLMEDADNKTSDNSDMLMMMMMQGQNMNDMGSILPLMLLGDKSLDFKSLFLMTNMMNQDCSQDTDQQMNMLLPMLLSGKYYCINIKYFLSNYSYYFIHFSTTTVVFH